MIRPLLSAVGTLFVGLGFLGILLPGLPTTPFLLVAAGLYVRSSERLYRWLTTHKLFGPPIRRFQETRAIPRNIKIIAITMMLIMVGLSGTFAITSLHGRIILGICALAGLITVLAFKTDV